MSINLDAMTNEELEKFCDAVRMNTARVSLTLFPTRPMHFRKATTELGRYAEAKTIATNLRESGHIQNAMIYEERCERIYGFLPEYAKW